MADAAPTALTEAFKKVVGDPANPAGVTQAGGAVYATPAGARPSGDIINISQAPGLMYTPAEQWAHESDLARQTQNTLEQNRQYDLSKAKFDYDKQRQQTADLQNALALQQSMRYGGGGGGGSYGRPMTLRSYGGDPYAGWNRVGDHYLPPTMSQSNPVQYQRTGGQQGGGASNYTGSYEYKMPGYQNAFIMAPAGLTGPALGRWSEQQQKQYAAEGRAPPMITNRAQF